MSDPIAVRRERVIPAVEDSQRELRHALDDLQAAVQSRFDIRARIAAEPFPWIVGGFVVGLWIGSSFRGVRP